MTPVSLPSPVTDCLSPMELHPTGMTPRLQALPDVRVVLFDVYGTLLISNAGENGRSAESGPDENMRTALQEAQLPPADALSAAIRFREIIESTRTKAKERGVAFPEVDIRKIWRSLADEFAWRITDDGLVNLAMHYEILENPVWAMPGANRILKEIHRHGLSLGIISNAQFYTRPFMEHLIGSWSELGFDDRLCCWSYLEGMGKPSPELFEKVGGELKSRGISAAETLFIGNDMCNDIEVPARLGWRTALFVGDMRSLRSSEGEINVRPDRVLTELDQVSPVLFQSPFATTKTSGSAPRRAR